MASDKERKRLREEFSFLLHENHEKPYSRRQFLSQSLLGLSAWSLFPVLGGNRSLFADECAGQVQDWTPFLIFDLAGGAGLPGNFLVGKQGGPEDLLKSYDQLGWDPRESGALNKAFGLPMSTTYSKILEGILANASEEAQANLRMGSFCHFARDDTSANQLSTMSLLGQLEYYGKYVSKSLGTRNTISGGNSIAADADESHKPLILSSAQDLFSATQFFSGDKLYANASKASLSKLLETKYKMGEKQLAALPNSENKDKLSKFAKCSFQENKALIEQAPTADPRQHEQFQRIYAITPQSALNSANVITATVAMNVLYQNTGPGVLTIGGCDYHDGTQNTGDNKDLQVGVSIGRAVEAAHVLKRPLFFQVITDGGVYSSSGTRNWRGDAGEKSMTVIGYYNPNGAPKQNKLQVGHYTDGQGADRETDIGDDPAKVAYAVFANYLNIQGKIDELSKYVPGTPFSSLKDVLIFDPMV